MAKIQIEPRGKVIAQKKLICVNPRGNNNKYIICKLYDSQDFGRWWGRIRADSSGNLVEHETSKKTEPSVGTKRFEAFIKSKTRSSLAADKKYTIVDTVDSVSTSSTIAQSSLKKLAMEQIQHNSPIVKDLIQYLADVNVHQILSGTSLSYNDTTGLFSTPFGVVTSANINQARSELNYIANCVVDSDWKSNKFLDALEQYLRLIPHDIGTKFNPEIIFPDVAKIQLENDILDALSAAYTQATSATVNDSPKAPSIFNVQLKLVKDKNTINDITNFFKNNRNSIHAVYSYRIKRILEVKITSTSDAFEKKAKSLGNVRRLFHGTKSSHLLSILKSGLQMPPAGSPHVTGSLFGRGCYASDQSTKALQYAAGYAPGQTRTSLRRYFMFVCRFAMGKMYSPSSTGGRSYPKKGYDSTFARGGQCGYLRNNEMIVYDPSQVSLDYLLEFTP